MDAKLFLVLLALLASPRSSQATGCLKPADVVAAVDGSGSISVSQFEEMKASLLDMVDSLGVSQDGTHLGLVVFSDRVRVRIELSGDASRLKAKIMGLKRPGGGTQTHKAIQAMVDDFRANGRVGVSKVGLVVTDGKSANADKTKKEAASARKFGVAMFAVGVGQKTNQEELDNIASSPSRVVQVEDFGKLLDLIHDIVKDVCDAADPECTSLLDVVAVVDGSGSISSSQFRQMQDALLQMLDRLHVSQAGTRLAVVLFGSSVTEVIELSGDGRDLHARIQALKQPKGSTATDEALKRMAAILKSRGRRGVARAAVVLTDGRSDNQDRTEKQARVARDAGISLFVAGIGKKIHQEELAAIASSPSQVVLVEDFQQLLSSVAGLVSQVCSGSACNKALELMAVVDGSGSISEANFRAMKNALIRLVDTLHLTDDQIRMGLVLFATSVHDVIDLTGSPGAVKSRIAALTRPKGYTNTHLALAKMTKALKEQAREGVARVAVVFTDGSSTDRQKTQKEAQKSRDAEVNLLAVGVGPKVNLAELKVIASSADQVLQVEDFEALAGSIQELVTAVCQSEGLCDGCRMVNGAGFNAHPSDCTKYIQCRVGANDEVIPDVRPCPTGLFWDQDKLTCNYPSAVDCASDLCRHGEEIKRYVFPGQCREFWECQARVAAPRCCPQGTSALRNGTCVPSDECEDPCSQGNQEGSHGGEPEGEEAEETCTKRAVEEKPNVYEEEVTGWGWIQRPCAGGTIFDPDQCACVNGDQAPPVLPPSQNNPSSSGCRAALYLPFTHGVKDESGHGTWVQNDGVKIAEGSAYFDGSKSLRVPRFTNFEFGQNFVVRLRYRGEGEPRAHQAVVSNGDCGEEPTVFIARTTSGSVDLGYVNGRGERTAVTVNSEGEGWEEVDFVLSGGALIGTTNRDSKTAQGSGTIKRNHCALQIGGGFGFDHFKGYIDEVTVFLCLPSE